MYAIFAFYYLYFLVLQEEIVVLIIFLLFFFFLRSLLKLLSFVVENLMLKYVEQLLVSLVANQYRFTLSFT